MTNTVVALADKDSIAAELVTGDGVYGRYDLARIRKSPDNRKRFNEAALQELAASIQSMGVAQPILIRPVKPTAEAPEDFEIVAGERRYRASIIAGMATIPAMCRELSDLDAAKLRILENLQREDPHPMEEAEGYQLLMLQHGFTADQLADEVKKSRAYIYARLKLCALTPEVREQFLDDKISASTALLIARIPVPKLQLRALGEILKPQYGSEPMSYRQAAAHVQSRYMLDLGTAIFKLADSKLLATAGACTTCPKRAGNQPEVFEGIGANVCTDPDCFSEKRAAHHAATIVQANKKGIPVYDGDEGVKLLQNTYAYHRNELVQIDSAHISYFDRNAPTTQNVGYVRTHLNDDTLPPVAAYVTNSAGAPVALYKRDEVQAALEAAGVCETVEAHAERMQAEASNPAPSASPKQAAEAAKRQENDRIATDETTFRIALYKRLRQRGAAGFSLQSLREFLKFALTEWNLPDLELCDIYDFDTSTHSAVCKHIDEAGLPEIQLLLIDMMLGATLSVGSYDVRAGAVADGDFATVLAMAKHEGIDPAHLREELFPTPIDVTAMQYADLVDFIRMHPSRIDELTKTVLKHPRGELVGLLEQAATSQGYIYTAGGFLYAPLAAEAASNTRPEDGVVESPAAAGETACAAADEDALNLADQLAETEKPPATPKKAKPAAKAAPVKSAPKPAVAAPAKKPAKAAKAAAATGDKAKSSNPWPFPTSSSGKREAPAPAAGATAPDDAAA